MKRIIVTIGMILYQIVPIACLIIITMASLKYLKNQKKNERK